MELNEITEKIIGAAIEVHRGLEPGLLESAYEECLCYELKAVDDMTPLFSAQVLACLKSAQKPVGLRIHFNVPVLKDGVRRIANRAASPRLCVSASRTEAL